MYLVRAKNKPILSLLTHFFQKNNIRTLKSNYETIVDDLSVFSQVQETANFSIKILSAREL